MFAAMAACRRVEASRAAESAAVVSDSMGAVMRLSSLDDQFAMQRAGSLDGAKNGNHVARARFHPGKRLHQIRDGARAREVADTRGFLDIHLRVAHRHGADARAGAPQVSWLRHAVLRG